MNVLASKVQDKQVIRSTMINKSKLFKSIQEKVVQTRVFTEQMIEAKSKNKVGFKLNGDEAYTAFGNSCQYRPEVEKR